MQVVLKKVFRRAPKWPSRPGETLLWTGNVIVTLPDGTQYSPMGVHEATLFCRRQGWEPWLETPHPAALVTTGS